MKQLSFLVLAAVLGSFLTVSSYEYFQDDSHEQPSVNAPAEIQLAKLNSGGNASTAPAQAVPFDFTKAAAKSMPSVVHIKAIQKVNPARSQYNDPFNIFRFWFGDEFDQRYHSNPYGGQGPKRQSAGSGVIITANGYIVTNNHVVEGATELEVTTYDNRSFSAKIVGTDPSTDLALIKVDGHGLPSLELADSDEAKVGEWVLAVGNPFNLSSTVTAGIISAKGRNLEILRDQAAIESFIQTDAAVNPGNSGGALVNVEGKLLGINTAIATPTGTFAGYSFAVPTSIVKKVVEDIMNFGSVQRAYLGIHIRDLDNDLRKEQNISINQGVFIQKILAGSAAENGGLQEGDVVTHIDGVRVNTSPELQEQIGRHRPGDVVNVKVNRNGKNKNLKISLKNNAQMNRTSTASVGAKGSVLGSLGVELEELSASTKKKLDIDGGVKISRIANGKIAQHTDIKEGFIITKINEKNVDTVDEVLQSLESKKGGIMLEGVYADYPGVYYYAFGM